MASSMAKGEEGRAVVQERVVAAGARPSDFFDVHKGRRMARRAEEGQGKRHYDDHGNQAGQARVRLTLVALSITISKS